MKNIIILLAIICGSVGTTLAITSPPIAVTVPPKAFVLPSVGAKVEGTEKPIVLNRRVRRFIEKQYRKK